MSRRQARWARGPRKFAGSVNDAKLSERVSVARTVAGSPFRVQPRPEAAATVSPMPGK